MVGRRQNLYTRSNRILFSKNAPLNCESQARFLPIRRLEDDNDLGKAWCCMLGREMPLDAPDFIIACLVLGAKQKFIEALPEDWRLLQRVIQGVRVAGALNEAA